MAPKRVLSGKPAAPDPDKHAHCRSQLGGGYDAASFGDILVSIRSPAAGFQMAMAGVTTAVDPDGGGDANVAGPVSLACVQRFAPVRFTVANISPAATDPDKDARCSLDFGPNYSAALPGDVMGMRGEQPSDFLMTFFGDTGTWWISSDPSGGLYATKTPEPTAALVCVHR